MRVEPLSIIFRAKFRDAMKKTDLLHKIPPAIAGWNMNWNVNCQAIGNSQGSIKYLAPYVFKIDISNSRIIKVENNRVYFKYKKQKSNRWRVTSLDVMEFIRWYLQHVLPSGFMKVRHYGFMNPNSSISPKEVSSLIELTYGFNVEVPKVENLPVYENYCPDCGGKLTYLYSILPYMVGYG